MHKIYSRPRIRIPKFNIRMKRKMPKDTKAEKMTILTITIIIAFLTCKFIIDAVMPIFDTLCQNRAESIATIVSNEQSTAVMAKHNYDEMYTIEKDKEENITMIKSNIMAINEIISDIANNIQKEIDNKGKENIEIALRKFYRI